MTKTQNRLCGLKNKVQRRQLQIVTFEPLQRIDIVKFAHFLKQQWTCPGEYVNNEDREDSEPRLLQIAQLKLLLHGLARAPIVRRTITSKLKTEGTFDVGASAFCFVTFKNTINYRP